MLDTLLKHLDMVRLSAGMALLVMVVGCTGLIENGGGTGSGSSVDLTAVAQQKWATEAYPLFQANCISCHGQANSQTYPGFLVGTDAPSVRTTILGFDPDVVDTSAAASSAVLTKGVHEGPAWTDAVDGSGATNESATILDWIQAEVDAAGAGSGSGSGTITIETALIQPTICTVASGGDDSACTKTIVDLTPIGLPGATISFVAQPLTSNAGLYIDYLTLTGAADGAYIEHPLFVSYPPGAGEGAQVGMNPVDPIPDDIDRFYALKLDVMPSTSSTITPGEAAFTTFGPNDPIKIGFKVVTPYVPATTGTPPGGCKDITDFITHAQPDLNTRCASCHAGNNANAMANMDLTGIATPTNSTAIAAACAQALTHVLPNQIAGSGLLIEPDPAQAAGHPYKITDGSLATYQANLTLWITPESQ